MLDFSSRQDPDLVERLADIEADPSSYVQGAREDLLRVLHERHPGKSLPEILRTVSEATRQAEERETWVNQASRNLLEGRTQPETSEPTLGALGAALRRATNWAAASVFFETLLLASIPALFGLGVLHLVRPNSLLLAPFQATQHMPLLKGFGAIPRVMAMLIALPFELFAPTTAAILLGAFFLALVGMAAAHVLRSFKHLIRLRNRRTERHRGGA